MRKWRGQGVQGSLGSSSLNCKRCALVDYLQEQVMMLQEISQKTKRYQGGRERVGQWVPIPVVGNRSLLGEVKNSPSSKHGEEGGREGVH